MPLLILVQLMSFALVNVSLLDSWEVADGAAGKRRSVEMAAGLGLAALAFCCSAPQLPLLAHG